MAAEPSPAPDYGALELHQARDLTVLKHIQREPSDSRIAHFKKNWDDAKVMILFVARITHGRYKGRLHVYDGGSRWRAMADAMPFYVFACWVRDMSEHEAAAAFLSINRDGMKPNSFANYKVGVRASEPAALAIRDALDEVGLVADPQHSRYPTEHEKGEFSPFAAASKIVHSGHERSGDWEDGSRWLALALQLGQRSYPTDATTKAAGYDADMLQAVNRISQMNPIVAESEECQGYLARVLGMQKPGDWKLAAVEVGKNIPGSTHRGMLISRLIISHHNRSAPARFKLEGGLQ